MVLGSTPCHRYQVDNQCNRQAPVKVLTENHNIMAEPMYLDACNSQRADSEGTLSKVSTASNAKRKRSVGGLAPWQLRRVLEHLENNIHRNLPITDLATIARLSASQFCRAFKASTGTTPHRWHLNARVIRAQALLVSEQISLADVAVATGFADQSHFTRIFLRTTSCTPGAWRRRFRISLQTAM